jgi:hypothetical protein
MSKMMYNLLEITVENLCTERNRMGNAEIIAGMRYIQYVRDSDRSGMIETQRT